MATSERSEFAHFYATVLLKDIKKLEAFRRRVVSRLKLLFAVSAAVFMISVGIDRGLGLSGTFPVIVAILSVPVVTFLYRFLISDYVHAFKLNVIQKIVNYIDPDLAYCAKGHVPKWQIVASRIFSKHPDRVRGDDLVQGKVGETTMQFSEVHAEAKHETASSGGAGGRRWSTIFRGLFFVADFNKKFRGKTLVLPDTAEQVLGNMGSLFQSLNRTRGELVKMEDPDFEKYFVVYADDQIEARYILSTSLMRRILEFRKKTGRRICLSFVSSHVYVAIPYRRRLFEPRVFRSILGFKGAEQYLEDFRVFVGIVEDLNLNTRIWTKRSEEPPSPLAEFFLNFPASEPY
jgi:hypothetical protein